MIKGIIAPPDTAIIISPDISLALSGRYCKARESNIENTFAHTSPIIKIEGQIIDKKTTLAARKRIYSYLIEKESNLEMIEFIQKLLEERKEEIKVKQK